MSVQKKKIVLLWEKLDGQGIVIFAEGRKKMPGSKELLAVCREYKPEIVLTDRGIGIKCQAPDLRTQNHFRDEVGEFYGAVIKSASLPKNGGDAL